MYVVEGYIEGWRVKMIVYKGNENKEINRIKKEHLVILLLNC